jgi:branched-chain amino acid transport system substrate-binding protein
LAGPYQYAAAAIRSGIQASVNLVNAGGGILGRQVAVTYLNDAGDPTAAVTKTQSSVASGVPSLVYGGISSDEATAIYPLSTRDKFVIESNAASSTLNNPAKYPYGFSDGSDLVGAAQLAINSAKAAGVKTLGVVVDNDAYGQTVSAGINSAAKAAGIKIVDATFPSTAVNMVPQFSRVLAAKPQMLFTDGQGPEVPALLTSRVNAGGGSVPLIVGQGASQQSLPTLIPASHLVNTKVVYWSVCAGNPAAFDPSIQTMVKELKKDGVKKLSLALDTYSLGYDALMYYRAGVTQAKSFDPAAVSHALENLSHSASAPWTTWAPPAGYYTPTDHFPSTPASAFTIAVPANYNNSGTIG